MDRIDLHVNVAAVEYDEITAKDIAGEKSSTEMYEPVAKAAEIQQHRLGNQRNAMMSSDQIELHCVLEEDAEKTLKQAFYLARKRNDY